MVNLLVALKDCCHAVLARRIQGIFNIQGVRSLESLSSDRSAFHPEEFKGSDPLNFSLALNLIGREVKRRGHMGLCRVPEPYCRSGM